MKREPDFAVALFVAGLVLITMLWIAAATLSVLDLL